MREAESKTVGQQLRGGRIATSRLSEVEIASALARRQREGAFTMAEHDRAIRSLNKDLAAWLLVEFTSQVAAAAQALLIRHPLRTGDAVQLASCLYLRRETGQHMPFGACDDALVTAARAEGLTLIAFGA